jgi:uncharacterized protein YjbJ (UPF0337 family)
MVVENFTGQSCNFARSARAAGVFSPRSRRFFKKVRLGTPSAYRIVQAYKAFVHSKTGGVMNNDIAEGKWKQMIGKAKTAWGELTDDELTKAEGRADKLAGLIQERYGKTRDEAELEVRRFFDSNRPF